MLYRMVKPTRRKGSSKLQFVQHIPWDIKDRAVGMRLELPIGDKLVPVTIKPSMPTIRASLRTSDSQEAKIRNAEVAAYLETVWRSLRHEKPVTLTHKQAVALSKDLYRAWAQEEGERRLAVVEDLKSRREKVESWQAMAIMSPRQAQHARPESGYVELEGHNAVPLPDEEVLEWEAVGRLWEKVGVDAEPEDLEPHLGPLVDKRLSARGIGQLDARSRGMILQEFWRALSDAFESRKRQAEGNYEPDLKAQRFPEWEQPATATSKAKTAHEAGKLDDLLEGWWKEAKATGYTVGTYEGYRNSISVFRRFLKHSDASRVTTDDVRRFKDHRLAKVAATTAKKDLAGLKAVFDWAVANDRLDGNPVEGVTVKFAKPVQTRSKGLTPEEAKRVLTHAFSKANSNAREHPKTQAAKRWVSWLCAYTGARVGELVQLRKQDVRYDEATGSWAMTITPEAGTVKDKQAREIPLHPHLIELGFVDFVKRSKTGYLFLSKSANAATQRRLWRDMKARITGFIREVVPDPAIKRPNHAWRHAFKTIGREAGIQETLLDAICGHAPRTVGGTYGETPFKAKVTAINQFPRFRIDQVSEC